MHTIRRSRLHRVLRAVLVLPVLLAAASCAGVDMVSYTSQTYPSKPSVTDVQILEAPPETPHVRIATLEVSDSKKNLARIQHMILEEAAKIGADGVVFGDPKTHYDHGVRYAPVYRPYGWYSPYYGYQGFSYADAVPVKYKTRRNTLVGTAIKYTNDPGPG